MPKLIYCATPSRLMHKLDEIMDYVTKQGNAPLHPFQALPFERFEGNIDVGREKSMEYCLRLINISEEFYLFGVSDGTLKETNHGIKKVKPITLIRDFDSEWDYYYKELGKEYGNPLEKLLKP